MLKLITAPNPILKQKSQELLRVDDQTRQLFNEMLETMYQHSGIGLAAVQVGIAKAMLVIDLQNIGQEEEDGYDDGEQGERSDIPFAKPTHTEQFGAAPAQEKGAKLQGPLFLANPKILHYSEETVLAQEGCLSVPQEFIDVPRAEKIVVQFLDYHNQPQTIEADGWLARVIQHEMDHLAGVLMIDYVSRLKRSMILRRLEKKR
ncbi:Peptide deformylase [Rickettsiales endosymbiont of Paramecium tredecaurelia]|nr:Peptide deformylase [Candidatus Sarmatiella mevalonica]